jgi:transcription initiation factor IIE alpha subunit
VTITKLKITEKGLGRKPKTNSLNNSETPKNEKQTTHRRNTKMIKGRLPESGKPIVQLLEKEGPLTQKAIIDRLSIPVRTIRYGIRRLMEKGYIKKLPNLRDMRSVYYFLNPDLPPEIRAELLEPIENASEIFVDVE